MSTTEFLNNPVSTQAFLALLVSHAALVLAFVFHRHGYR